MGATSSRIRELMVSGERKAMSAKLYTSSWAHAESASPGTAGSNAGGICQDDRRESSQRADHHRWNLSLDLVQKSRADQSMRLTHMQTGTTTGGRSDSFLTFPCPHTPLP